MNGYLGYLNHTAQYLLLFMYYLLWPEWLSQVTRQPLWSEIPFSWRCQEWNLESSVGNGCALWLNYGSSSSKEPNMVRICHFNISHGLTKHIPKHAAFTGLLILNGAMEANLKENKNIDCPNTQQRRFKVNDKNYPLGFSEAVCDWKGSAIKRKKQEVGSRSHQEQMNSWMNAAIITTKIV